MSAKPLPQPVPGQRYKFIVRSAEEAADAIRQQLGETARVISVRQVEGEGLARFLRSPRLEIIAELPPPEAVEPSPKPVEESKKKPARPKKPKATEPDTGDFAQAESPEADAGGPTDSEISSEPAATAVPQQSPASVSVPAQAQRKPRGEAARQAAMDKTPLGTGNPSRLWTVLARAGLPNEFLARISDRAEWKALADQPLHTALARTALLLRNTVPNHPCALSRRVAFCGSPGSGATTALCKQLATDVFLHGKQACVMKLDAEEPNSTEGLAMFCEALGVPLLRTPNEVVEVADETTVYFDVPGTIFSDQSLTRLRRVFDDLAIESRVLVVNAAYDRQLIQQSYTRVSSIGATHVVFTHLDELNRCGKLWEFVLDEGLVPLFASTGQNVAGDCERQVIDLLVRRTISAANS